MEPSKSDEITKHIDKLNFEENKNEDNLEMILEDEVEVSEGIQEFHKNSKSRFLSTSSDWENEKFALPEKIKQALRDAEILRPSKIQAYAIPLIQLKPYKSVVAQSHNGSGKTFAFALSALLRVDPEDKNLQVLVLAHTRELVHQIYEQIKLLNKYTEYNLVEVKKEDKAPKIGQITVITPAKWNSLFKFKKLNFTHMKLIVVDEADFFFGNENDWDVTTNLIKQIDTSKEDVQKLFFSATYPGKVTEAIKKIIPENSISIRLKKKRIPHPQRSQADVYCR